MTNTSFIAGALALAGLFSPAPIIRSIPAGKPFDITMTASTDFDYPMRDVDLVAVFSGPGGRELVLPGFWDGGRTFRIRFTPTAVGEWIYSTVSSEPGLDAQMGHLDATAANPVAAGFSTKTTGAAHRSIAACDPDCGALFGDSEERPDLTRFRALDATVAEALGENTIVDLRLFARDTGSDVLDPHLNGMMDYLLARYAAFPNVVWCGDPYFVRRIASTRPAKSPL